MYVLKKAIDFQSTGVIKLLESIAPPSPTSSGLGAELTGLGQNLDIRA